MTKLEKSFWGDPKYEPRDKDVARFLSVIRDLTEDQSDKKALGTATSALQAIVAFIAERFGLKEVMALLDRLRAEVTGQTQ